jgi:hypothetical protein
MNDARKFPTFPVRQIKFPIKAAKFPGSQGARIRPRPLFSRGYIGMASGGAGPNDKNPGYFPVQTGIGGCYTSVTAPVRPVINP